MDRANLIRFLLLALIWGSSFLFIEIALRGVGPHHVVVGRLVAGALVLLLIVAARGESLPRAWRLRIHLAALGIVGNILPFFLFAWAQQRITSGLAGILNGATPLFTLAIAVIALPDERFSRVRVAGLLLGLAGVVLVVGPWDQDPRTSSLAGQLACLGAALCYGVAFVYTRRFLSGFGHPPISLAAGQLTAAAVMAILIAPWLPAQPLAVTPLVTGSILLLGAGATGVAYPLFYRLVAQAGATTSSLVTYLIPVVAVTLGVVVLNEPVTWNLFVGAGVVILGIAVAEGRLGGTSSGEPGERRAAARPSVDAPPHPRGPRPG